MASNCKIEDLTNEYCVDGGDLIREYECYIMAYLADQPEPGVIIWDTEYRFWGGGTLEETVISGGCCGEITKRTGAVYRVCCDEGKPIQTAGGTYSCTNSCGNCTETLISP